jgi:Right handed beta helix region
MKRLPVQLVLVLSLLGTNLQPLNSLLFTSGGVSWRGNTPSFIPPLDPHSLLTGSAAFTQLDLIPNIETMGVVVSGANLPKTAALLYRQNTESDWHSGPPLVRIDDGRLVGSLFGLSPSAAYNIKVSDGPTEITGSATTQLDELQFVPSTILHVNDDAPSGGDGSVAAPFRTIQEGINHAGPGTQVLVADGTYHEAVTFPASGSVGNWIQIKAEGSASILDGADNLSGNIWTPSGLNAQVWVTKIGHPIGYLARDQNRFYMYDDLPGLLEGRGHSNIPMNEGWYLEPTTGKLYVRSQDDPSKHAWQVPRFNHAFDVDSRDWIWIEGFEMRYYGLGTDGCGVCTKNASHVVIRKNRIHGIQLGVFINWNGADAQGNDSRVEYNEIYDPPVNDWPWKAVKTSSMEGTAIVDRGHIGSIVRNNIIHHIFNGIYTGSSAGLENPAIAFDVDIYNNYIHHIGDDGLEPEGASVNQRFRDNTVDTSLVGISLAPITIGPVWVLRSLFVNFTGRAIKWDKNSDGIVLIYHNTSWTAVQDVDAMTLISPMRNATLRNNIFQSNGFAFNETLTGSTGNDWNNDNWYTTRGPGSPHFKWENVNFENIAKLCAATGLECQGYEGSPGLSNPGGGDFKLLSSSPNIDRGVVISGINDKFSGKAPDVGVYEFAGDTPPSALSISRADINPSGATDVNFAVGFSEPVTGVDINDFVLAASPGIAGAFISSVTAVSATTYTVNVNAGSGNGTLRVDLADDDSILDLTNNSLGGAGAGNGTFSSGELYTIDKNPPTVAGISLVDPNFSSADSVHFAVNFSKAVTGVDASDFALTAAGSISNATVSDVSGGGTSYTVTAATGVGDGTLRLNLVDNDSIIDAVANPLGGPGAGNGNFAGANMYTIDKSAPRIIGIVRSDPSPTSSESVRFAVNFSEAVSGVDLGDFRLITPDKFSGVSITAISGSSSQYTVTVASGTGNGTIRLDLADDDSILDSLGHPLGGPGLGNGSFSLGEVYTINQLPYKILSQSFSSKGNYDGWVLESGEDTSKGGSKDSNSSTFNIGDDAKDRQFRAILYFTTKDLPDKAVINQVILMIKKSEVVGADPFTSHKNISIDIRQGSFGSFGPFSYSGLQVSDFQAQASRNAVGEIRNNPVGDWYWSLLDNMAHPFVSLVGVTQLRLLFQIGDNDDQRSDYLKFFSGDFYEEGDRPQLMIKYHVPK